MVYKKLILTRKKDNHQLHKSCTAPVDSDMEYKVRLYLMNVLDDFSLVLVCISWNLAAGGASQKIKNPWLTEAFCPDCTNYLGIPLPWSKVMSNWIHCQRKLQQTEQMIKLKKKRKTPIRASPPERTCYKMSILMYANV